VRRLCMCKQDSLIATDAKKRIPTDGQKAKKERDTDTHQDLLILTLLLKTDRSQESQQHLNRYLLAKYQPAAELAGFAKVGQKLL
jgi:hypothetical protein